MQVFLRGAITLSYPKRSLYKYPKPISSVESAVQLSTTPFPSKRQFKTEQLDFEKSPFATRFKVEPKRFCVNDPSIWRLDPSFSN